MQSLQPPPIPARPGPAVPAAPLRLNAAQLFAGGCEVAIAHAGETYRLRLTRQNKLILTK